jgi:hypothetical protein
LFFEESTLGIKDDILKRQKSIVQVANPAKLKNNPVVLRAQRRARGFINKFCSQLFKLFTKFRACGGNASEEAVQIRLLCIGASLPDEEIEPMRLAVSKCIAKVHAEDVVFSNLMSGEGFVSTRDALFSAILTKRRELEESFRSDSQRCIQILETTLSEHMKRPFAFQERNKPRILQILQEYYTSPFEKRQPPCQNLLNFVMNQSRDQ